MFGLKKKIEYTHKCLFEFPFTEMRGDMYPFIEVDLKHIDDDKSQKHILCLLDSGADNCVFPMDLGEKLGIDFTEIDPIDKVRGVAGEIQGIKMYKSRITISFLGIDMASDVIWIDQKDTNPLIGRNSFFNFFDVYFKRRSDKITLVFHPTPRCQYKGRHIPDKI